MKRIILSLSLTTALASSLFAYKDFDTFGDKSITKSNSTNVAFRYYQTGISDTILVLKDEIKKSSLYNSNFDVENKFVVYVDVSKKSLEEIIFFRAVAQKTNLLESYLINKNKNDKYVLFGIYDNEIDANFALGKINEFNIPAVKKFIKKETYSYDDMLLKKIDEGLEQYGKKVPVKVLLVKEKVFVNKDGNEIVNNEVVKNNTTNVAKEQQIQNNNKIIKTKNKKTTANKTADLDKRTKYCLVKSIYNIRSYGLFNNKALKFKYKNHIYAKGDKFVDDETKCNFVITDVYTKHPANLVIQFDNYTNDKLVARLQTYQDDFVSLSNIFYDFEADVKKDEDDKKASEIKSSQTITKPEQTQTSIKEQETNIDTQQVSDTNIQTKSNDLTNIEPTQFIDNKVDTNNTQSVSNNKKVCNFDALSGIRTQLVDEDGKITKKPVLTYYQGKQVEVNFYPKDDIVLVSSPNSSEMKISKKDFEKNCK